MSSQKQIDANRRNAQSSTGPRTPEGRAAVRLNALTHGLTAANLVLHTEDQEAFEELLQASLDEFDPQTPTEQTLVEQLVCASWRLRRLRVIEQGIFDDRLCQTAEYMRLTYKKPSASLRLGYVFFKDASGPEALSALSRFEGRIERSYYRALRELRACRDLRRDPGDKRALPAKSDLQKQSQLDPEHFLIEE